MAANGTYTWNFSGSNWATSSDWTKTTAGAAAWADSGSGAYGLLFELGAGTGPYTVNMGASAVQVGAVSITSSNAIVNVGTSKLEALAGAVTNSNGAGGTLTMNGGTIELGSGSTGGYLQFYTMNLSGGAEITGFGTITNPSVSSGSNTQLTTSGANTAVIANGGLLNVVGSGNTPELIVVSGSVEVDTNATFEIGKYSELAGTASATVNFQSDAGTLSIYNASYPFSSNVFTGTLANMAVGNTGSADTGASVVDFQSQTIASASFSGTGSAGTIVVTTSAGTYDFDTTGTTAPAVNWTSDGSGGDLFWLDNYACYVAGTHILTDRGEVAVENLREGDQIITVAGDGKSQQPVKWIGTRRLNLRAHRQPNLAAPVRIRQHAFGLDLPHQDLLLSPDHCLFVAGKLIPAKLLINDMTIVQELGTAVVHYYHVELERHAVMFAEGLPAESYLDTGNRAVFSNAGLALTLHPEFAVNVGLKRWETDACAPLMVAPEGVKPVWASLMARAESLGHQREELETTGDPALCLVADGRRVPPLLVAGNRYVFVVPAGAKSLRLASRASVPSAFAAYVDDWRRLGVALRRITVRDTAGITEVPPDHPALTDGWYAVERDGTAMWRWMNGNAVLPPIKPSGPAMLEAEVGITTRYVVDAVSERLAA